MAVETPPGSFEPNEPPLLPPQATANAAMTTAPQSASRRMTPRTMVTTFSADPHRAGVWDTPPRPV